MSSVFSLFGIPSLKEVIVNNGAFIVTLSIAYCMDKYVTFYYVVILYL